MEFLFCSDGLKSPDHPYKARYILENRFKKNVKKVTDFVFHTRDRQQLFTLRDLSDVEYL